MNSHKCLNNPDIFCCFCGSCVTVKQKQNLTRFFIKAYFSYFDVDIVDQYKEVCESYVEALKLWSYGKKKLMPFAVSMTWKERKNNVDDPIFAWPMLEVIMRKAKKYELSKHCFSYYGCSI